MSRHAKNKKSDRNQKPLRRKPLLSRRNEPGCSHFTAALVAHGEVVCTSLESLMHIMLVIECGRDIRDVVVDYKRSTTHDPCRSCPFISFPPPFPFQLQEQLIPIAKG